MQIQVITLFPEMLKAVTEFGVTGSAVQNGVLQVGAVNPREFATDKHGTVDDRPFGGGPGMVMKVEPLEKAVETARKNMDSADAKVIYLSPQGETLNQHLVEELGKEEKLILLAGRYEGIDERFIEACVDREISLGDYVLSGGELPAMVLVDSIARTLPGVLGHEDSASQDSFSGELENLLDCPHYTRPEDIDGAKVPEVLLSGNHEKIRRWRLKRSLERTWIRRPDLLEQKKLAGLSEEEQVLLDEVMNEFINEQNQDDSA